MFPAQRRLLPEEKFDFHTYRKLQYNPILITMRIKIKMQTIPDSIQGRFQISGSAQECIAPSLKPEGVQDASYTGGILVMCNILQDLCLHVTCANGCCVCAMRDSFMRGSRPAIVEILYDTEITLYNKKYVKIDIYFLHEPFECVHTRRCRMMKVKKIEFSRSLFSLFSLRGRSGSAGMDL